MGAQAARFHSHGPSGETGERRPAEGSFLNYEVLVIPGYADLGRGRSRTRATAELDARLHVVGYWGVRRSFSQRGAGARLVDL